MALWGTLDQADNAPKYTTSAENGDKGADDFGTTVFGVSTVEATVAGDVTPGWVKACRGYWRSHWTSNTRNFGCYV